MVIITGCHCFVINENISSSVDVIANFVSLLATKFVALRFIIGSCLYFILAVSFIRIYFCNCLITPSMSKFISVISGNSFLQDGRLCMSS